jgi:type IV pilus assembly protein PilE
MKTQLAKTQSGFTLIELMITVSIVAILMAVGIPSYQRQVQSGLRSQAQQVMMELASREEQFMMNRQAYTSVIGAAGLNYTIPSDVQENYTFTITEENPPVNFEIKATAIGNQASDGNLTLSGDGSKTPAGKW